METSRILEQLRAERDRIDRAIAAIEGLNSTRPKRRRPNGRITKRRTSTPPGAPRSRRMSAAARKKIAAAQQERWAKWRKKRAAKKA